MFCEKCGKEINQDEQFCTNCGNKVIKTKTNVKINRLKKNKIIYIIIVLIIITIIGIIIYNAFPKDNNTMQNEDNNDMQNEKKVSIIFDNNTKYGATFNLTKEEIYNTIELIYPSSDLKKILGNFETNHTEWVEVNNNVNTHEIYFYTDDITEQWRNMGMCAFKIGVSVDTNNYVQSINFTGVDGTSNNTILEKIILNYNVYESFYYYLLSNIFEDISITNNLAKIERNKINGMQLGGVGMKDDITYGYMVITQNEETMFSRQLSLGTVGKEHAQKLLEVYTSQNVGIYVELDESKIKNINTSDTETNKNEQKNNVVNENNHTSNSGKNNIDNITSNNDSIINNKEMINVPYFDLGNSLEKYTKELYDLGIAYKVVKGQDLNYPDNTVMKVEHNGERIEKGTTIKITVTDNIYNIQVQVSTSYLLGLADLGYDYDEVSVALKINGVSVYNGKLPKTNAISPAIVGTYKGKPDNLQIEATIEGKKINKKINYVYFDQYVDTPYILIYKGGDIGAG